MKQDEFLSYLNQSSHKEAQALFADKIKGNKLASKETRLQIYAEGYFQRLYAVMSSDYPACEAILGSSEFELMVGAYLKVYPSQSESLVNVGKHFARFLLLQDKKLISDLASFEWELAKLEYSDEVVLDGICPSDLENHNSRNLKLRLSQKIKQLISQYPLDLIYERELLYTREESFFIFFKDRNERPRYRRLCSLGRLILDFSRDNMTVDSLLEKATEFESPSLLVSELITFINQGLVHISHHKAMVQHVKLDKVK